MKNLKILIIFQLLFLQNYAQQGLIKYISAENATILPDWRLDDNNIRYSVAISGSSYMPQIDSSQSYNGKKSILYQCPAGSTTQRIEHKLLDTGDPNGLNFSDERYIGFAVKIPDNFDTPTGSVIFCQAWQGDPYGPPAMLKIMPSNSDPFRIKCNIRNIATGPNSADPDSSLWQGYLDRNKWYSFVWYIKPRQTGDSGMIKLWINDSLQFTWTGNIGYLPESQGGPVGVYPDLVVKYGIYQPGSNTAHSLYFDEIKASDTYEEAIPFSETPVQEKICAEAISDLYSGFVSSDSSYQWQIDAGNGFQNIHDNAVYQGSNTGVLIISNPPTVLYGARYQCIATNQIGILYSLKFSATWTGNSDTDWKNSGNWNCGILPDMNTDVIINSGAPNFPIINSNATCRSLSANSSSMITITNGSNLTITSKP